MNESESQQRPLIPFYLVVDVSYSMQGEKLAAANQICPDLATAVATNPLMRDKTRFGIMTFSDDAQMVVPISDLASITQLPVFREEGGTSFRAAFDLLRKSIEADVATLKADGFRVYRPAVFFVTDGAPTDEQTDWQVAHRSLIEAEEFKYWPNVIGFGVDGAVAENIAYISHPKARFTGFMQGNGVSAADAIKKIAEVILNSVLTSAQSAAAGTDPTEAMATALNEAIEDSGGVLEPAGDFLDD